MPRRPPAPIGALVASLVTVFGLAATGAAASPAGLAERQGTTVAPDDARSSVRQRQADLAAELDVLRADSEEVAASLAAISANVAEQQELTRLAGARTEAAWQAESEATERVRRKQAEVDELAGRLRDLGLQLYIRPPLDDTVHAVVKASPNDAPTALALARIRTEDMAQILRERKDALDELDDARQDAATARHEAERAERSAQAKLADLETARLQQQRFADEVADRIERAMAEAGVLSTRDAELSAEIRTRELELASRLRETLASPGTPAGTVRQPDGGGVTPTPGGPPPVTTIPTAPGGGPGTTTPPPTTVPPGGGPPTTAPPTVVITPVETVWVRGIEVAASIAGQVEAMLAAAADDGLVLTGYGYRNILDQIQIRREVCGTTEWDIFFKPSWECSPPAAIPGRSMHEKGLAIDFSEPDGDLIRTRNHPVIRWLTANASRFGLYNLPSEPWHWSTTGG